MSDINIILQTILSSETKHLEEQIRILSEKIKEKILLKTDVDISDLDIANKKVEEQISNIQEKMSSIKMPDISVDIQDKIGDSLDLDKIDVFRDKYDKIKKTVKNITDEHGKQIKIIERANKKTGELKKASSVITENYKKQADMLHKQVIQQIKLLENIRKKEATKGKFFDDQDIKDLEKLRAQALFLDENGKDFSKGLADAKIELDRIIGNADIYKHHVEEVKRSHSEVKSHYKEQNRAIEQQIRQKQSIIQQQKNIVKSELRQNDLYKSREIIVEELINRLHKIIRLNKGSIDALGLSDQVKNLESSIKGISLRDRDFNNQIKQSGLAVNRLSTELSVANRELEKGSIFAPIFGQSLWEAGKKFASWLFIGNIIMQIIRQVRDGISLIKELDKDLTEISMITGLNRDQTRELAHEYANLGAQLGKTVREISSVNKELIRQGLSIDVAKKRLEDVLKFSATANISAEQSLQVITSSVNAMKESAEVTSDILLKAGAVSASSAEQIGEAFTKTASSAYSTGMSIENLTATIATMIEVTQESPSSLGNSMKTLLARFNKVNEETGELNKDLNQVQKAFESVGITFLDLNNQIRPVDSLLEDLNKKWKTLDKNTKLYIATQAAGIRQQNRFLAIMDNYSRVQEIQNDLVDSAGTTAIQYSHYLDSVEASANKVQVALEKMWINTLSSDTIKTFYSFLETLVKIVDKVGILEIALSLLATMVFFSSEAFKILRFNIYRVNEASTIQGVLLESLTKTTKGWTLAIIGADVAINILYFSITLGLSFAITKLIIYINKLVGEYKALQRETNFMVDNFGRNKEKIDELIESYKELHNTIGRTEEQEEEYIKVKEKLAELLPSLKAGVDEEGKVRLKNIEIIDEEYQRIKALNEEKRKERMEKFETSYNVNLEGIEKIKKELAGLEEAEKKLKKRLSKKIEGTLNYQSIKIELDMLRESIEKLENELTGLKSENFDDYIQNIIDRVSDMGIYLDSNVKDAVSAMVRHLNVLPKDIDLIAKHISSLSKKLSKLDPESEEYASILAQGFEELGNKIDPLGMKTSRFTNIISKYVDEVKKATEANNEHHSSLEGMLSSISDAEKNIKAYQTALKELDETGSLSISTMSSILDANENLIDVIGDEILLRKELERAIEEEKNTALKAIGQKLMDSESYYSKIKKEHANYINELSESYGVDLTNFDTLAKAKFGIEKQLLSHLSNIWAGYVGLTVEHAKKMWKAFDADSVRFGIEPSTQEGYGIIKQLIELEDKFKEFSAIAIKLNFDVDKSSSSKAGSFLDKLFSAFPGYEEQIKDLANSLAQFYKGLSDLEAEITIAETMNDTERLVKLHEIIVQKRKEERDLLHQTANKIREIQNQISKEFQIKFNKDILSITETEIKNFADNTEKSIIGLQNKLDKATSDSVKNSLQRQIDSISRDKELFDVFIGAFRASEKEIEDLGKGWMDAFVSGSSEESKYFDSLFALIDEKLKPFRDEFESLDYQFKLLDDDDIAKKQTNITNRIFILTEIIDKQKQELLNLNNALKDSSFNTEELRSRKEEFESQIRNNTATLKQYKDELKNMQKSVADNTVEIVRESYRQQEKIRIAALNKELKGLEEAHKERTKFLDEELSKYQDIINAKLELIDRTDNEESYERELKKLQEERMEIVKEINILALDDSMEARVSLSELNKKLTDQDEKIEIHKEKRSKDLRKQNLKDQLDNKKKEVEETKKTETDKFESEKKRIEDTIELEKWKFDELINNEASFAKMREDIINGHIDKVSEKLTSFIDEFKSVNKDAAHDIGISWQQLQNTIGNIEDLQSNVNFTPGIPSIGAGKTIEYPTTQSSKITKGMTLREASAMAGVSVGWDDDKKEITLNGKKFSINSIPGTKFDTSTEHHVVTNPDALHKLLTSIGGKLHDGGIVGGIGSKVTELFNKLLNTKSNEQLILGLKNELFVPEKNLNNFAIPNIQKLMGSPNVSNVCELKIDSLLTVNGNVDNSVLPDLEALVNKAANRLAEIQKKNLNMAGVYKGV